MFQMLDSLTTRLSRRPVAPVISSRAPTSRSDEASLDALEAAFFAGGLADAYLKVR